MIPSWTWTSKKKKKGKEKRNKKEASLQQPSKAWRLDPLSSCKPADTTQSHSSIIITSKHWHLSYYQTSFIHEPSRRRHPLQS